MQGTLSALRRHLGPVIFLGLVHIVGPFLLITYGEVHISSSLTGLLIAIEPVLIALLMLRAEPLTRLRVAGLARRPGRRRPCWSGSTSPATAGACSAPA